MPQIYEHFSVPPNDSLFFCHSRESVVYDSAWKVFVYKTDYPAVLDGAAEYLYEFAVTHGVKEAFEVKVNYIFVAFIDYLLYFPKCVQASPSRTEAETSLGELGLIDYRQYLVDGLLHHAVNHGRYAQQALLAIVLGYLYPSDGIRTVGTVKQGTYQFILISLEPWEQLLA